MLLTNLSRIVSLLVNEIGDVGVSAIAEALKVNNTLNKIFFWSE